MTSITIAPKLAGGMDLSQAATIARAANRAQVEIVQRELEAHHKVLAQLSGISFDATMQRIQDLREQLARLGA